ncbi:hypothetical protein [Salmonella enterica]|uniref:hypothetical protein n=1 Tax=Salmonella enterica TaxID=28901 RepID=UPI001C01AF37|nr:hypothetical protein [Salmonella enterica]MBT9410150.1 hypothetical protein [Salmonella enterica subsp. enterica serovar Typhimurium]
MKEEKIRRKKKKEVSENKGEKKGEVRRSVSNDKQGTQDKADKIIGGKGKKEEKGEKKNGVE